MERFRGREASPEAAKWRHRQHYGLKHNKGNEKNIIIKMK